MTPERTIDILKGEFMLCPKSCEGPCEDCELEAFLTAIETLERQKPVEVRCSAPNLNERMFSRWTCGNCGCRVARINDKYCGYCGRPFDWRNWNR